MNEIDIRVSEIYKKCPKCCSSNCTQGKVQRIPLQCIDWQVSYSGHLFCADIVKDEQLKIEF